MDSFRIINKEYGKAGVRMLHVAKHGDHHSIQELEVETALTLNTEKDYRQGDNSAIVATDSQKNTVYILAKQHGVKNPETFALLLAEHFLNKYPWVVRARVDIKQYPWQRIKDPKGQPHNHAFLSSPSNTRLARVILVRGHLPHISVGLRDLTVIKTTQSAFANFVDDEYRTLADAEDRIFSTIVTADWSYTPRDLRQVKAFDFDKTYEDIKAIILDTFAGPAEKGIYSPSVQNTQFLAEKRILQSIPQVEKMSITMPNRHYFPVDFSRFPIPNLRGKGSGEVLMPVDKPSGLITSSLARKDFQAKL